MTDGIPDPDFVPDEKRDECENCEYETDLHFYRSMGGSEDGHWYCEVCSSTFLSKATEYPHQVADPLLFKSIAWIANKILDEIRGGKSA